MFIIISTIILILLFLLIFNKKKSTINDKQNIQTSNSRIVHEKEINNSTNISINNNKSTDKKNKGQTNTQKNRTAIRPSYIMSMRERKMFHEIEESVPEYYIFVQVCLGAILWTKGQGTRNKFSQKMADFVITDKEFNIKAVIELDDKSHIGKEKQDEERDAMVKEAGYKVLRYRYIPDRAKLRSDIIKKTV